MIMASKINAVFSFYGVNPEDEKFLQKCNVKGLLKGHGWSYTKEWKKNEKRDFGQIVDNPNESSFYMFISVELKEDPRIHSNVVLVEIDKKIYNDTKSDNKKIGISFYEGYDNNSRVGIKTIIIGSGHPFM